MNTIINIKSLEYQIEKAVAKVSEHPFICNANNKAITKNQAVTWLMCAGRESKSFPEIIKNMLTWVNNEQIRLILSDNLNDEYGNGDPEQSHFNHYMHLLNEINISENDFCNYTERAGVKLALSLAYNISMSKDAGITLGYMLINEALTPLIYEAIKTSLQEFYPDLKTDFFDIHINVDKHHVAQLIKAAGHLSAKEFNSVNFGIQMGERGMSVLLDEAVGTFDYIDELSVTSTGV